WTNLHLDLGSQTMYSRADYLPSARAWTWMSITVLGNYDADLGGQIILWDADSMVRLPSGSSFLVPPLMRVSLAAVQPGETRYCITQYARVPQGWAHWPSATQIFSTEEELRVHT
ncbi:hypothetical protein FB45DRAFT_735848, partial [Roridomyces roridus]